MTPPRRRKDVTKALKQGQPLLSRILGYADVFMRQDREQVEGVQVFDQTIDGSVCLIFSDKGSKEPVPNDQGPRIIGV